MSLDARLSALITAIGADIKALTTAVGTQNRYAASTTQQVMSAGADTYLAGSSISVPNGKIKAGTIYRCKFDAVKTAAGIGQPAFRVRLGTAGTIADTAISAMVHAAQTAVIDEGTIEVDLVFRNAGASAIPQGMSRITHRLGNTGFSSGGSPTIINTGAAFNTTTTGLIIGTSVNPNTSASWTINFVSAELLNLG